MQEQASSWWDDVLDFGEGAFESLTNGATTAIGKWADNGFGLGDKDDHLKTQATQAQPQASTQQAAASTVQSQGMNLTNTQLMIGGGIALVAVVLLTK